MDEEPVYAVGWFLIHLSTVARTFYHEPGSHERLEGINEIVQVLSKQLIARMSDDSTIGYPTPALAQIIDELAVRFDCGGAVEYAMQKTAETLSSADGAD